VLLLKLVKQTFNTKKKRKVKVKVKEKKVKVKYWSVKKTDIGFHKLRFNNNYENPLILGWNKFKKWHRFPKRNDILTSILDNLVGQSSLSYSHYNFTLSHSISHFIGFCAK
jgi:hypothetical protein